MGDDIEENDEGVDDEPAVVEDTRPRTDIAPLITDSLVAEINDKNWKVSRIRFYLKTYYITDIWSVLYFYLGHYYFTL